MRTEDVPTADWEWEDEYGNSLSTVPYREVFGKPPCVHARIGTERADKTAASVGAHYDSEFRYRRHEQHWTGGGYVIRTWDSSGVMTETKDGPYTGTWSQTFSEQDTEADVKARAEALSVPDPEPPSFVAGTEYYDNYGFRLVGRSEGNGWLTEKVIARAMYFGKTSGGLQPTFVVSQIKDAFRLTVDAPATCYFKLYATIYTFPIDLVGGSSHTDVYNAVEAFNAVANAASASSTVEWTCEFTGEPPDKTKGNGLSNFDYVSYMVVNPTPDLVLDYPSYGTFAIASNLRFSFLEGYIPVQTEAGEWVNGFPAWGVEAAP